MFSFTFINFIILIYLLILVISALLAERWIKKKGNKSIVANPYIYSLSMAVYCTSWTYYGSVGIAAHNGMLYLGIYLGASLTILLYPWLLKHLISIKEKYHITSVADFIVARYDKSQALGVICAAFILVGIIPYIAIQIKSILDTVHILVTGLRPEISASSSLTDHYIVIVCIIVTIVFGLRKLDSSEKHPGLVFILAGESFVKLIALFTVGVYATYVLNNGFDSIFDNLQYVSGRGYNYMGHTTIYDFFTWCTYLLLSASAILFLPRQFQVAVVENYSKKHIKTSSWLFPLYLFLINIFVIPLAFTGLSQGFAIGLADSYVLLLPMKHAQNLLTLFVFIGGFSAAIGMIMIETVAVSTIVSNQLFLPLLHQFSSLNFLTKYTLRLRWFAAIVTIYTAYYYAWRVGPQYALVSMGLISFAAVLQFVPAILAGLFWKKANKYGAIAGISFGALIWFYTLFIPAFAKSGYFSPSIMIEGPFGLAWLRPESILGLGLLNPLSHAVFWTMFFNIGSLVIVSVLTKQSETEEKIVKSYEELLSDKPLFVEGTLNFDLLDINIPIQPKLRILEKVFQKYLIKEDAQLAIERITQELKIQDKELINIYMLSQLHDHAEKFLSGLVGTSVAFYSLENSDFFSPLERRELGDLFARLLAHMKVDPRELSAKLAELQYRQGQLEKDAQSLEVAMQKKSSELEEQKALAYQASKLASLGEVAAGIAHEINNPLAIIGSSAQIMENMMEKDNMDKEKFKSLTTNIKQTVQRASRIVQGMRNIARQSEVDLFEEITVADMLEDSTNLCTERFKSRGVELRIFADEKTLKTIIEVNRTTISQSLINFLNNAFDAIISKPEKWVEINAYSTNEFLRIKIIDSGPGISPELQEKIFQPFFTTKDVGKGTGLGLSLAVSFIKQHNGSVFIDNQNPHTCFVITLPLKHNS